MQEAEAARDFSKLMEHIAAGDEIFVERDGKVVALVSDPQSRRPKPSHIDDIDLRLRASELENGLIEADPDWAEHMREARVLFNTPKEEPWA